MVQVLCGWVQLPLSQIDILVTCPSIQCPSFGFKVFDFQSWGNGSAYLGSSLAFGKKLRHATES